MADRLLVDTDILIDYLRGLPQAVQFIDEAGERVRISVVSAAELYAGAREAEMDSIRDLLASFPSIPVTFEIARTGGLIRRQYMRSHRVDIPDALIAATAHEEGISLATLNRKHFPMLPVVTPYTKP